VESPTAISVKAVAPDVETTGAHPFLRRNKCNFSRHSFRAVSLWYAVTLSVHIGVHVSPVSVWKFLPLVSPLTCSFVGHPNIPADVNTCAHSLEVKSPLFPVLVRVRRIMRPVWVRYSRFCD
jgi:hypothetical protein